MCLWGERAAVCQSVESPLPLPSLLSAQAGFGVVEARRSLVSLLSGALPRPCLSVCLPVCFGLLACPSVACVTLLLWRCCPAARPQNWHGIGAFGRWLHTRFIISVTILSYSCVDATSVLVRASAELPNPCPIKLSHFCFKDLLWPTRDYFVILFVTIKES